jgi:ABC-2 type transport system ATP-binding protein
MQTGNGLVLSRVRKAFRNVVAVDDLTVTVPSGSLFGLLGANGAGKTTTLRLVLNILSPDAGSITWAGQDVTKAPRHTFGYLPEERGLYPKMKTGEELVFLASLNDVTTAEATRRAHEWLGRVGLGDAWNRKVEELSKGNQQKVQVLAAILHDPQLMLLDEPFSGLDPINTDILRDTLLERRAEGKTIIFSSHRLEQVEELCDHVGIIHRGRLLSAGPISEVKRTDARRFVEVAFDLYGGSRNGDERVPDLKDFLAAISALPVAIAEERGTGVRLEMLDGAGPEPILRAAMDHGPGPVMRFEVVEPTLQEVFIAQVRRADPEAVEQMQAEAAFVHARQQREAGNVLRTAGQDGGGQVR